jgi:hypothetical protein
MPNHNRTSLPIALRVYPELQGQEIKRKTKAKPWRRPEAVLVFDTESRIDETQALTFGSYRYFQEGACLEEGLFYADDLPDDERAILQRYVSTRKADTAAGVAQKIRLLTRSDFVERFYKDVYKGRYLLVGFNLPFDLSRIAYDATIARGGKFSGGFSFALSAYGDDEDCETRTNSGHQFELST